MKAHTTNYTNTFIAVADDCPVEKGEVAPLYGRETPEYERFLHDDRIKVVKAMKSSR
ncbi:hypothetical protein SAMN05421747_10755 [Parapedobacter composti]|uniref:Uncharacterized protein n=1 Tax=Parapedobacter composti TaxID=623281 RepID=A0A1I1HYQ5_9SPHI|nr:hypothetical protein [Parapedobacter composti]SFC26080.1 hypothetical protein SAMN05421747_10755 [Parapedobacter composti]